MQVRRCTYNKKWGHGKIDLVIVFNFFFFSNIFFYLRREMRHDPSQLRNVPCLGAGQTLFEMKIKSNCLKQRFALLFRATLFGNNRIFDLFEITGISNKLRSKKYLFERNFEIMCVIVRTTNKYLFACLDIYLPFANRKLIIFNEACNIFVELMEP